MGGVNELINKYSDILFAAFVISAVGMIMIPMPLEAVLRAFERRD